MSANMKKLAELRRYLAEKIAYFMENPDNLSLFVETAILWRRWQRRSPMNINTR
ncbi:hypothetical protein [Arsenophonus sp. aPb]|uniref:hypothetical protein n=1 Tax=Arsenophonus sp. aPb TaxID=3041619 RepID=UPI0032B00361